MDDQADIARLLAEAERLAAAGEWDAPAEAINKAMLRIAPRNVPAINRLARCLSERGDSAGAVQLWQAALKIDPKNQVAANRLAASETLAADQAAAASYTDAALARHAGVEARHDGRASRAAALLKRSLELERSTPTLIALAALDRERGSLEEAARAYVEILNQGLNIAAAVGLAAVRRDQKRPDLAIDLCELVLSQGFDTAAATVMAACYTDLRQHELAEKWAALAVAKSDGDPRALAVLMASRARTRRT
jgi:tetratricopeptide (TPR) repeat protein